MSLKFILLLLCFSLTALTQTTTSTDQIYPFNPEQMGKLQKMSEEMEKLSKQNEKKQRELEKKCAEKDLKSCEELGKLSLKLMELLCKYEATPESCKQYEEMKKMMEKK